jgi:putative nucleotidyltransferase with HDIG domain
MNEAAKKYLDLNCKILEKFKSAAPGSFSHCVNVANLCESIAKELDLESDIIKLAGIYHDIGKMWNPGYFSENITDKNPHDNLDPFVSYQIITRHVSDSICILTGERDFPREVLEIISRHHGDTVLKSIYIKAKDENENVPKHAFQYKTNRPNCVYSSILMIVDGVEATAKSFHNLGKLETSEDRINLIEKIISDLCETEQLDELKFGTLRRIKEKLIRELDSIYHHRIPYGDEDSDDEKPVKAVIKKKTE